MPINFRFNFKPLLNYDVNAFTSMFRLSHFFKKSITVDKALLIALTLQIPSTFSITLNGISEFF